MTCLSSPSTLTSNDDIIIFSETVNVTDGVLNVSLNRAAGVTNNPHISGIIIVPEPSSTLLFLTAGAGLLMRRKRV